MDLTSFFIQFQQRINFLYQNKYTNLLSGLILLLLLSSLFDGRFSLGGIIVSFCFLTNIVLVLQTLSLPSKINFYLTLFAIAGFSLTFINLIFDIGQPKTILITVTYIVYIIYLSGSIFIINKHIFDSQKVTADILKGAISIYLMIGLLWYLFYDLILLFDSEAFSISIERLNTYKLVHFSYTTLTTIGYGDISPVNRIAMVLTNLEGIIGQLYPTIFIARLVSLYQHEQ